MTKKLIGNGYVVTFGPNNKVIDNGAVLIENDKIIKTGDFDEMKKNEAYDDFIDARGNVIMPGMINTHMHFYSTFARGLGKAKASANFPEILENLWWRLDKKLNLDDVYYSAMIPLIECIKNGTTTVIDHHASPFAVKGSLNRIEDALRDTGIKGCLCYELSDRDGKEISDQGIQENIDFIKKCKESKDGYVTALFGMHASMTINEETLKKSVQAVKELDSGFHVHTAEDISDVNDSNKKYGCGVIERWNKAGVLGPKTILPHCIHISEKEEELLLKTGTNVVHNPESNMNNAVGTASVLRLIEKGVNVGLGTDGMNSDMFQGAKVVNLIHKIINRDPRVGFCEAANMLIQYNPAIGSKFFRAPVGVIEPGAYADIIILDYDPPTPFNSDSFMGHLLFGMSSGMVDTTISNGRILMLNRHLVDIDEKEIAQKSRELAQKLWDRF
jgi:putative selenium metabolism protein SsnA